MPTSALSSLASQALRVQAFLASNGATPGLRAALVRVDPQAPSLPALAALSSLLPTDIGDQALVRWLAVAKAFALAGPRNHALHVPLGLALRRIGLSEQRFTRLLAAPAEVRDELLWRTCHLLQSRQARFNFVDLAALFLTQDHDKRLSLHLRLSRDYLRAFDDTESMADATTAAPATAD